jgi:3-dehydroquinate synthase
VWIDVNTLQTLPRRELLAGLAEVIKYGVIYDSALFAFLEEKREEILNLDSNAISHIIKRSCEIKSEVVSKDERESGLRAILNYGHTIGHAIETVTKYRRFLHGEAVAIGMYIEARLATMLELIDSDQASRIKNLIESYGLRSEMPPDINAVNISLSMKLDKKTVSGELKFILPKKIGAVEIFTGVSDTVIRELLKS